MGSELWLSAFEYTQRSLHSSSGSQCWPLSLAVVWDTVLIDQHSLPPTSGGGQVSSPTQGTRVWTPGGTL